MRMNAARCQSLPFYTYYSYTILHDDSILSERLS